MRRQTASASLAKVVFELGTDDWHGYQTESVWAEPISCDRFRILNTPFFAKGVSFEDVVITKKNGDKLLFKSVSIAAGHSTYRILLDRSVSDVNFLKYWNPIEQLGCSYESMDIGRMRLLAVDVRPKADIQQVYRLLDKGENESIWSFEEGHCGHPI